RLPRRPCGGDGTAARAHREGDRRGPAPSPRRTCAGLRTVPAGAVGGVERRVLPRRAEGEIMRAGIVKGAIAALASVSLLAACGGGDDGAGAGGGSDHTWRLGYNVDYNSASLYAIAEDQALNQGDRDIAYIGPGAHWLPASGKAKIITINGLGTAERILAQPGITSMKDLAGHTVGAPEGTSGELLLNLALEEAGMTKEDIDFVPMDPSTVVSSFSSGKVDAAAIWYPLVGTMKKNVPDAEELSSSEDFVDEVPAPSSFVTTQEIIDSEQDGLSDVIAVL